jgi:hypothetical protein
MRRKKHDYIFTKKEHPLPAIMGTILGVIGLLSWAYAIISSYSSGGVIPARYGVAAAINVIYALVGLILGVYSLRLEDTYRLFPVLAVVLNLLALLVGGFLLWIPT